MKTSRINIALVCLTLLISCGKHGADNLAGTYTTAFKNEFSIADDTLVVEPYNLEAGTFTINRNSGYHRIRAGKVLPKEFKREHWIATFNEATQVLQETEFGKQISVNLKEASLSYGSTYKKEK